MSMKNRPNPLPESYQPTKKSQLCFYSRVDIAHSPSFPPHSPLIFSVSSHLHLPFSPAHPLGDHKEEGRGGSEADGSGIKQLSRWYVSDYALW